MSGDHTRAADLKRIHAMQREVGLQADDATAVKIAVTGVASSGAMTVMQRAKYIGHLAGLVRSAQPGAEPRNGATKRRPKRPTPSADAAPLVRRVRAQLISLGRLPDTYADGIAKQMLGAGAPEFFEWCAPRDLYKISQALGVEQKRKGANTQ